MSEVMFPELAAYKKWRDVAHVLSLEGTKFRM